ncbi:hypothetical protein [Psychroflexus tropicus]|uniref:hypothetical protein n=1 Tax=Psychroflexus tropicus TaxID=197345 RepID=UPI00037701CD|nr:hypothetical protein [Psychroflexus tropicus]
MALGSTSFASSNSSENIDEAFEYDCVAVTLSCGVSGDACGVSTEQILTQVTYAEEYWCGD